MVERKDSFSRERQWPELRNYQVQSPQQNLEIISPEIYSHKHPAIQGSFSPKELQKFPQTGCLQYFFRKLGETYEQPHDFEHSQRVPDSFSVSAWSEIFFPTHFNDLSRKSLSGPGDRTNLKQRHNKRCPARLQSFPQFKKGLRSSPSDKFEKNQYYIPYSNFKMKGFFLLKEIFQ